jgi:hypothetical protein
MVVDTSDREFQTAYQERGRRRQKELARLFGSLAVDHIPIVLAGDEAKGVGHVDELVRFFKRRERRR